MSHRKNNLTSISTIIFTILVISTPSTIRSVSALPTVNTIKDRHAIVNYITEDETANSKHLRDSTDETMDLCKSFKSGEKGFRRDPNSCSRFYRCMVDPEDDHNFTTMWFECDDGRWYDDRENECKLKMYVDCKLDRKPNGELTTTTTRNKSSASGALFDCSFVSSSHYYLSIVATWIVITIAASLFG